MKCPKCGSENTGFISNRNVSRGSFGKGCCGYILLGPIGILCGLCGKEVDEEEYWICQECGHKFSERASEKAVEKEEKQMTEATKYRANKTESNKILEKYGTHKNLESEKNIAFSASEENSKTYKKALKEFIEKSDDAELIRLVKAKKRWDLPVHIMWICFGIAVVSMLTGLAPLMTLGAVAGIVLMFYVTCRQDKELKEQIDEIFINYSEENKKIYKAMRASEARYKVLKQNLDVVEECAEYEKKQQDK